MRKVSLNAFVSKKIQKRIAGKCRLCSEDTYEVLDLHRVIAQNGYNRRNTTCICSRCHRKHHSGIIDIKGWCDSTNGRLLHWFDENGMERFS